MCACLCVCVLRTLTITLKISQFYVYQKLIKILSKTSFTVLLNIFLCICVCLKIRRNLSLKSSGALYYFNTTVSQGAKFHCRYFQYAPCIRLSSAFANRILMIYICSPTLNRLLNEFGIQLFYLNEIHCIVGRGNDTVFIVQTLRSDMSGMCCDISCLYVSAFIHSFVSILQIIYLIILNNFITAMQRSYRVNVILLFSVKLSITLGRPFEVYCTQEM